MKLIWCWYFLTRKLAGTEESQDPARRKLRLEGRIWLIWLACFPSCGSHYTSPSWPGHMVRRCQSAHHWGTHRFMGRTHAGSKQAQENQVHIPVTECAGKQWQVQCLPFEVGCRGFAGISLITFLHKLGITHRERNFVCKAASNAALRASTWIWAKHRNGPSWCHRHQSGVVLGLAPWSTGPPSRCGTEFRAETTSDGRHSADDLTGVHRTLGVSSSVYLYIAWRPRTIVWCKRTCLSHGGCRQWYF